MPDYSTLELGSIFMHQVTLSTRGGDKHFEASLTDVPVQLDPMDVGYLRDRFCDALEKRALSIVPSDSVDSPTPRAIRSHFDNRDLKKASQTLAIRLAESQKLTAKTGLLVVADATLEGTTSVLIAKVEHQEAMQAEPTILANGDRTLSIKRIPDLVFGEQNRIYKVAVIRKPGAAEEQLDGYLADIQNGGAFANYYLGEFLGMRLADEPEVLTERFMVKMTEAIQQSSLEADEKMEAQAALAITLKSNALVIDASQFVQDFIPYSHQMNVLTSALARGVPMASFTKDSRRINPKLDSLRIDLGGGISLLAPPDSVGPDGIVKIERQESESDEEIYDVNIHGVSLGKVTNTR